MRAEQGELELELEGQERRGPRVGLGDGSVQRILHDSSEQSRTRACLESPRGGCLKNLPPNLNL